MCEVISQFKNRRLGIDAQHWQPEKWQTKRSLKLSGCVFIYTFAFLKTG